MIWFDLKLLPKVIFYNSILYFYKYEPIEQIWKVRKAQSKEKLLSGPFMFIDTFVDR